MKLLHLALPSGTPYLQASAIQERLVRRLLDSKLSRSSSFNSFSSVPPALVVVTAEFKPVYTCGRRERASFSAAQISHLESNGRAEFHEALRGGQTTYHGPGQLTAYPILDLKALNISPRSYICRLEDAVINTCAQFNVKGFRTVNPGVWTSEDRKICAVGVHLRRYISSHGIGLNVGAQTEEWFHRIVACGLEGKTATSLETESGVKGVTVHAVTTVFLNELAKVLGMHDVTSITKDELRELHMNE